MTMPLQRLKENHIHNTHTNMLERQQYPFFSSTLLDKIYSSMEEGCEAKPQDPTFYRKTFYRKETAAHGHRQAEADQKRIRNKEGQKQSMQRKHLYMSDRKGNEFASSCSTSSDSSAAGFSSSDGESVSSAKKIAPSCFAPFSLKPVRTNVAEKPSKKKQSTRFDAMPERAEQRAEEGGSGGLLRSKAMKIYDNLKKVKHPISPGGRLSNLISSLFTSSTNKPTSRNKNKNMKSSLGERNLPTCTSASSFTRSCLSKNSPSTRDKIKNRDKRTVRFYPMIVTFDGDSKPCSRKWLYEEEGTCDAKSRSVPILVPKEWKIGRSNGNHQDQRKGSEVKKGSHCCNKDSRASKEEEESDDDASCTSSDLFELDHLSVIGFKGCNSELPVFESTRIGSNSNRNLKM